jgi:hypothetical protein
MLKQDKYHIVFCNDLGTKTAARSAALDTFYPFRPSKRVIIIHIQRQLSRLGFDEKGIKSILKYKFKWLQLISKFWHNPCLIIRA